MVGNKDVRAAPSLAMVRDTIDDIDQRLVALLAERLCAIRRASELKDEPSDALVEWRVEEVAANVRRRASQVGFDADAAERIWRAMMEECIAFERRALAARHRSREA
jgi:isochorismate pyruvate lyase